MTHAELNNYSHKWRAFIGIMLLSFGGYLDYTIVNVALPTIQVQLHANLITLQWVMNIYFLVLCILATIMGRCGDMYGRRRLFYMGAAIFTLASVMAGSAVNMHWLIIGRLLQGVGAAIVFPLGPSLLPWSFPEKERGKAIAWLGSVGGIALALGPVLGGLIVSHLGWRWIFFINIPLAVIGYLLCFGVVRESKGSESQNSLDWSGMLLFAFSIGGIVLSLIHSQEYGWSNSLTLSYLLTGIIASIVLVKVENKKQNPLIDFKDFKKILFFSGVALVLLAGALSAVGLFFDPLYLQILRGQSPQFSGLILFMIPIAVFGVALFVDRLIRKFSLINTIFVGLSLGAIASLLQIFFTDTISLSFILLAFFILGSMWALGNTVPIIAAQAAVGHERASVATGTIVTMFNLGASIGLAIAVVVYHSMSMHVLKTIMKTQYQLGSTQLELLTRLITNPADSLQVDMGKLTHNIFDTAFMHGFRGVMCFLFILAVLLLLSVWGFKMLYRFDNRKIKSTGNTL